MSRSLVWFMLGFMILIINCDPSHAGKNSNARQQLTDGQNARLLRPSVRSCKIPKDVLVQGTARMIADDYIGRYFKDLYVDASADLVHTERIANRSLEHNVYQQYHHGTIVLDSYVIVSVANEGRIVSVSASTMKIKGVDLSPSISKSTALELAMSSLGMSSSSERRPDKMNLCIVHGSDTTATLAWRIEYGANRKQNPVEMLISAKDGVILELVEPISRSENGKGRVFSPDPITRSGDNTLWDNNNTNYHPVSTYYVDNVDLLELDDPDNNKYYLRGKYSYSVDWRDPVVSIMEESNSSDFNYTRDQPGFEEVNIYYHIDCFRRYIASLGINPLFGSSQEQYISFDAHGFNGDHGAGYWNNINGKPLLDYGDGINENDVVDSGEDQDVIIHEYTHAIHDALMGTSWPPQMDENSIAEGSADYLAVSYRHSINSQYQYGRVFPWHHNDNSIVVLGQPRYVVDTDPNNPKRYPTHWINIYAAGSVWACTMMDLEASSTYSIGRDKTNALLLGSFSFASSTTSAPRHMYHIMQVDAIEYDGEDLASIGHVFYERGFFNGIGTQPSHTISANIVSNLALDEAYWINGQISIAPSVDVTVEASSFLYIGPNSKLSVGSGSSLTIKDAAWLVALENGAIEVSDGGYLALEGTAAVLLESGIIRCLGSGSISINDSRGLRGSGTLSNANITSIHGIDIREDQAIVMQDGGVFEFDCAPDNQPQYFLNSGNITFQGSIDEYVFGSCLDEIRVHASGAFVSEAGTILQNLPTLISWDNAVLESNGDQPEPCEWLFRSGAALDIYTSLVATYTTFGGSTMLGMPPEEWDGVLVGDVTSWIDLDYCTVQDVYVDPVYSGSGIHFYQSGVQYISRIRNSRILRNTGGQYKHGDGIFLQPGNAFSYVKLECSEINQDWYTGFTSVGSYPRIFDSKIMYNNVGIGVSASSILTMQRSCVEGHVFEGIDVNASELSFASQGTAGGNRVVGNANQQLDVTNGSVVYGGWDPAGGNNFEGHDNNISSTTQAWAANVSGSTAYLQQNWFGLVPGIYDPVTGYCYLTATQATQLFNGATILYDPAHCSEILPNCSTECPELLQNSSVVASFSKQSSLPTYASGFSQLRAYARAGNFAEVYRFVGASLPNNVSGSLAKQYTSYLMHLENEHVRNHPDTIAVSRSRLKAFLLSRLGTSNRSEAKAAILNVLARSLFALEDIYGADNRISQLRNLYPNSPYAQDILPVLQLVAMAQRDSVKMDNTISLMQSAGFSADEMRLARAMKRAYHRFRPQSPSPKRVFVFDDYQAHPQAVSLDVKNYPNPFNPTTVIEYVLPESGYVKLLVYDPLGREAAALVDEKQVSGVHSAVFDAGSSPSGIYMYILITPSRQITGKMMLAR